MLEALRTTLRTVALAAFAAIATSSAAARPNDEFPIECDEGSEPLLVEYGQHTVNCDLFVATDLDQFRFFGAEDDRVRIVVRGNTGGLDPRTEVIDPVGNTLADESCKAGCCGAMCTAEVELVLETSGVHTILLSDVGANNAGAYTLQLERLPPADLGPAIAYNSTVIDTLAPSTDADFWTFEAVAGARFRFIIRGTTGGLDPRIRLLNEAGDNVLDDPDIARCSAGCCGETCSFTVEQAVPASGRYSIMIDEWGGDNTGGYEASLQCLTGNCCPVPANLNGDCCLDTQDFVAFRSAFLAGDMAADFDGDGALGAGDFAAFRDAFLAGCP